MLSIVVSLIDQQKLRHLVAKLIFLPVVIVVLDGYRTGLLEGLEDILVDLDWVLEDGAIFIPFILV